MHQRGGVFFVAVQTQANRRFQCSGGNLIAEQNDAVVQRAFESVHCAAACIVVRDVAAKPFDQRLVERGDPFRIALLYE